ncbi:TetR/AcrR family transcriptional regulator [Jiangella aurantiaca]|uniref:TetR/AcrR family transcriptional regulator n=2 Tax=Jiangella aurantiaca TaxID=2530373 RepID=A0A4R5A7T0_9ACTN|nr:TetR/AcrR family transcriptional regulator [Jiangella aurantiaca]
MSMVSRRDWLDEGLAVLAEGGAPALTIDRLTGRLGVTKGSFYHHFRGLADFKTALLEYFEAEWTERYIAAVEASPAAPRAKLDHLLELVLADESGPGTSDPEVGVRAWALQDPQVRAVQERVDRARAEYLRALWRAAGGTDDEARLMGWVLYLVLVGASHVVPPVPAGELRDIYRLLLRPAGEGEA